MRLKQQKMKNGFMETLARLIISKLKNSKSVK